MSLKGMILKGMILKGFEPLGARPALCVSHLMTPSLAHDTSVIHHPRLTCVCWDPRAVLRRLPATRP